jgi:hypothetical protein
MTAEDIKQGLDRDPFIPLRLHLASGQKIEVEYPGTAWVRQNTLLVVHPIAPGTSQIGEYDVIALRLIERIEQVSSDGRSSRRRRKAQ